MWSIDEPKVSASANVWDKCSQRTVTNRQTGVPYRIDVTQTCSLLTNICALRCPYHLGKFRWRANNTTLIGCAFKDSGLCLLPKIAAAVVPTLRALKSTFWPITPPFVQAGNHKIVLSPPRHCTA